MTHILLELESVPDLIPEILLLERTRWVCQYVVEALQTEVGKAERTIGRRERGNDQYSIVSDTRLEVSLSSHVSISLTHL